MPLTFKLTLEVFVICQLVEKLEDPFDAIRIIFRRLRVVTCAVGMG